MIGEVSKMEITREEFRAYVAVQRSGVTNMMNVDEVIKYANKLRNVVLTREQVLYIMHTYTHHYAKYMKKDERTQAK